MPLHLRPVCRNLHRVEGVSQYRNERLKSRTSSLTGRLTTRAAIHHQTIRSYREIAHQSLLASVVSRYETTVLWLLPVATSCLCKEQGGSHKYHHSLQHLRQVRRRSLYRQALDDEIGIEGNGQYINTSIGFTLCRFRYMVGVQS